MKHLPTILVLVLIIILTGCAGIEKKTDCKVDFMGIRAEHFEGRDWKKVVLGAVLSFGVHEGSHILYAELNGGGIKRRRSYRF